MINPPVSDSLLISCCVLPLDDVGLTKICPLLSTPSTPSTDHATPPDSAPLVGMIDSFVQALQLKNPKLSDHSMVHNFLGAMENPFRTHKLWKGCEDGDVDEAMDCLEKKILSDDKVYQSIVSNMGQSWEQMDASFEKKKYCLEFLQPSVRTQTYIPNSKALNVERYFQDFLQPPATHTGTTLESLTSCFCTRLRT